MARPESTADVTNRWHNVGSIHMNDLNNKPALLKAVATFMEALEKAGGQITKNYSGVILELPKSEKELQDQLESDQSVWDSMDKKYEAALVSVESVEDGELNYEQRAVREWAKKEGRPDPFIVSEIEGLLR